VVYLDGKARVVTNKRKIKKKGNQTVLSLVIGTDINFRVDTDDIYIGTVSRTFFD
jgi:hypothetical protein